jgi:dihydrofolate reductase
MLDPRFRLYIAVSLDGFIADLEGGIGWLDPFHSDEIDINGFMAGIGTIVMGRTTYDQVRGFTPWPYSGKRVIVMTRRPFSPSTPDTEVWNGSVPDLADKLAEETETGDVWVLGGGAVARAFLKAGRLDTLELYLIPVLLGQGIPLFGADTPSMTMEPSHVQRYGNGIVRLDYEVTR